MTQGRTTPSMLATRSRAFKVAYKLANFFGQAQEKYIQVHGIPSARLGVEHQHYRKVVRYCLLRGVAT